MALTLETLRPPDDDQRERIVALARAVEARDGAPPLSDQALSRITSTDPVHRIAREDGTVVGYAQLDGTSLEIAANPEALGALLAAAETQGTPGLHVWSHGRDSALIAPLQDRGYSRSRVLHRLRLGLGSGALDAPLPEGVVVRTFVPGRDEDPWLALNCAAFAHHAEQGSWTRADLDARMAERWFDPAGFFLAFLAERDGEPVGFHWTKVHEDGTGEVYVIGVAPQAQGGGLGRALLVHGLRHLAGRGCPAVILYVDESNTAAMRLYERMGFVSDNLDIQWIAP